MEFFRDATPAPSFGLTEVPTATAVTAAVVRNGIDVAYFDGDVFTLPFAIAGYDGPFEIRWEFLVPGDLTLHTRFESHEIVTPLVDMTGATPADVEAERVVRKLIEAMCGQSFGFQYAAKHVNGSGGNIMNLPARLIRLDGISTNYAPYDVIPYGSVQVINNGWTITSTLGGGYLTTKQAPPEGSIYVSNGVLRAPSHTYGWNPGSVYVITGAWGYEGVPTNVSLAARMLIDDYNCEEDAYRNKFVANMRSADWRIEYDPRTWAGTGNIKADQLLSPYVRSQIGAV